MTTPKQQEKSVFFPAADYPDDIFQQTTPDESQELGDGPRFNTLIKGWRTRSEIYERVSVSYTHLTLPTTPYV